MVAGSAGHERYEDKVYGEGEGGSGAPSPKEIDLNMVSPEGLTPGYEGLDRFVDNSVEHISESVSSSEEVVNEPMKQMQKLLEQKIEATLAGNSAKADQIQKMIDLHAERNNIPQ